MTRPTAALPFALALGLAVDPDGSLYVTDDSGGRISRIVHRGR